MDTDVEICLTDVDQLQFILMTIEKLWEDEDKCMQMSRAMFFGLFGTYRAGCDINKQTNLVQLRLKKDFRG